MATVYGRLDGFSTYRDSRNSSSLEEQHAQLSGSKTLYVGNLSFYTSEEQIHELFRQVGPVRRIIMGLDVCLMFAHAALTDSRRPGLVQRHKKTPCGFCFVEYYSHVDARASLKFISGTKLDERIIRADMDPGYADGRQYGRGKLVVYQATAWPQTNSGIAAQVGRSGARRIQRRL